MLCRQSFPIDPFILRNEWTLWMRMLKVTIRRLEGRSRHLHISHQFEQFELSQCFLNITLSDGGPLLEGDGKVLVSGEHYIDVFVIN